MLQENRTQRLTIRPARREDVMLIAEMFASDPLGGHGDTADPAFRADYESAFDRIAESPNDMLYVAEWDGAIAGTFQVVFLTSLTARGSTNMLIEAVHTRQDLRGEGIGHAMIRFCIDLAEARGVRLVQLTSNAKRLDAHRFYTRLGFEPSHVGFKLRLC
jgi:GNAT superfamily N-acetyltransferase